MAQATAVLPSLSSYFQLIQVYEEEAAQASHYQEIAQAEKRQKQRPAALDKHLGLLPEPQAQITCSVLFQPDLESPLSQKPRSPPLLAV